MRHAIIVITLLASDAVLLVCLFAALDANRRLRRELDDVLRARTR